MSPGPVKVIKNLQETMKEHINVKWVPLEDILVPRLSSRIRKTNYRYLKLQERLRFMNIKPLLKYNDRLFFVGWGAACEVLLKKLNRKGIKPSLIMCSTIGQSDFTASGRHALLSVIKNVKNGNLKLFLLNRRLYNSFGAVLPNSIYFPHTINLKQFENIKPQELSGTNIDIFCSIRPGKNIMNQIFAVKLAQIHTNLHINFNDPELIHFINETGIKPVIHTWLDEVAYYRLIAGMTLSLQVTFTESFSYAVCERMCLSIPTLTSYDIYLVAEDQFLSKYLCINKLDTPSEITKGIKNIVKNKTLRNEIAARCRERIRKIADENNKIAKDYLTSYF